MKTKISNFREQLLERTLKFSENLIKVFSSLPKSPVNKVLVNQAIRSGTSIGANYREACEAESAKDFVHKVRICKKESKETVYWLELVIRANTKFSKDIEPLKGEVIEFITVFKKTPRFNRGDELNADMSSSLEETPRYQRGEDVIKIFSSISSKFNR